VIENQPTATITVGIADSAASHAASVTGFNYAFHELRHSRATAGSDYTATSGTLMFGPGETTKMFTIPITDDTAVEGDETIALTLSNPTAGPPWPAPRPRR